MDITPDILATIASFVGTAIVLFASLIASTRWLDRKITDTRVELKSDIQLVQQKLEGDIASTRAELKGEIQLVRQNSEEAHREINDRLRALKDQVHVVDKGLSTLTARVDCIDDKIDSMQRQSEEA